MLKALELIGFKSFADASRFEFPPGITAIVGPNGSGKSNVVDAIKWVLGEQSVKSLRGREMVDVIFNGTSKRPPLHFAEATVIFTNTDGRLAIDTPEVHITRRVYRNGEGEYLINRHPCRLRDIRELFLGTGITTEAYSVIEQGKVDILLQASPRERRLIFEEAAGISRFKIKKLESQRRLERIDQNLLRLADIVDEIESRLRSVRMQAAKARRYKEHRANLQELRTRLAQADCQRLEGVYLAWQQKIERLRAQSQSLTQQASETDALGQSVDRQLTAQDSELRAHDQKTAELREKIAVWQASLSHQFQRRAELEQEVANRRRQLSDLGSRQEDLHLQLAAGHKDTAAAQAAQHVLSTEMATQAQVLAELSERAESLRSHLHDRRRAQRDESQRVSSLAIDVGAGIAELDRAKVLVDRLKEQLAEWTHEAESTASLTKQLQAEQKRLTSEVGTQQAARVAAQQTLETLRSEHAQVAALLAEKRARLSAIVERHAVLEGFQRQLEGVESGAKTILLQAKTQSGAFWSLVAGQVADHLTTSVEHAPHLEAALGPVAQYLLIHDLPRWLIQAPAHGIAPTGRLGLMEAGTAIDQAAQARHTHGALAEQSPAFPAAPAAPTNDPAEPEARPDAESAHEPDSALVLSRQAKRLDQLVTFSPQCSRACRTLLAQTWLVPDLATAWRLAQSFAPSAAVTSSGEISSAAVPQQPAPRFVTLQGEVLESNGTVVMNPAAEAQGLISRQSELRQLVEERARYETVTATLAGQADRAAAQLKEQEQSVQKLELLTQRLSDSLEHHTAQLARQQARQDALQAKAVQGRESLAKSQQEHARLHAKVTTEQQQLEQGRGSLAQLDQQVLETAEHVDHLEQQRLLQEQKTTHAKVELAKAEERLAHLQARLVHFERDQQERRQVLQEQKAQLHQAEHQAQIADLQLLCVESQLAEAFLQLEALLVQARAAQDALEELRRTRRRLAAEHQQTLLTCHELEQNCHQCELSAQHSQLEQKSIIERMREDYEVDLTLLAPAATQLAEDERALLERDIEDLRRKLHHFGNVNLESIEELTEVEARHTHLSAELNDLKQAKASLEQLIVQINQDSKKLFVASLEEVRKHFRDLFQKLFGGGQAEIVMENEDDVLESGIEIVARPPGKEPRSISLLSGGERTLTCVALLLAIFRSRPSPFCVLDEVDAALDEANIQRFTDVLREFLTLTQFIVVTHSKKTMTCANTLYGITMHESGVSQRVAVRFEDVSDQGDVLVEPKDESQAA